MEALLERTIFKVDVLTVDLCLDATTSEAIGQSIGSEEDESRQRQAVASHAYAADQALGVLRFHRDVSMGQFLEGIADDHRRAVEAGLLADSTRRALADELPVWYAFLEDRGVKDGDRIVYRFEPDRVRATYVGAEGRTYLDRTSEGAQRRASVLGAYFAPGASLREGLLDSLFREGRDGADRCRVLQDEWSGR